MGKLWVLEGIDGTGKTTQFELLCAELNRRGIVHRELSFPEYGNESSLFVRKYLAGGYGTDPDAVSPYAASTFYALDRFDSYKCRWERDYLDGGLFVSCRYATSNAVHQGAKLEGNARTDYFAWLCDLEYAKMGIPSPDCVLLLDLPVTLALENIRARNEHRDIHETDAAYLTRCAESARDAAKYYGWNVIPCAAGDKMRTREDIAADIVAALGL